MVTILMALVPFLPELLKLFRAKQDNAHELAMMDKQLELERLKGAQGHQDLQLNAQLQEILTSIQAETAEALSARQMYQQTPSFGVQILDKAQAINMPAWIWVPVFWAFGFLDWVRGIVVPAIAVTVVALYVTIKIAAVQALTESEIPIVQAVAATYTDRDFEILLAVVSFYLGNRLRKAVFGGGTDNNTTGR